MRALRGFGPAGDNGRRPSGERQARSAGAGHMHDPSGKQTAPQAGGARARGRADEGSDVGGRYGHGARIR